MRRALPPAWTLLPALAVALVSCGPSLRATLAFDGCGTGTVPPVLGHLTIVNGGSATASIHDPSVVHGLRVYSSSGTLLRSDPLGQFVDTAVHSRIPIDPGKTLNVPTFQVWDRQLSGAPASVGTYGLEVFLEDGTTTPRTQVALPACAAP